MDLEERNIGEIGNAYGVLTIFSEDNKFYWGIDDCVGMFKEEIPEYLYIALNSFQNKLEQEQIKK